MAVIVIVGIVILFSTMLYILNNSFTKKFENEYLSAKLRTEKAVRVEATKIEAIIDNLQQALFAVGPGGIIVDPVTKHTEKIFGRNITGENVMHTLYNSLNSKKELYDSVESALITVMGENELQWDLVESNFPRKINYLPPEPIDEKVNLKLLKINISPIWDSNENLQRLLFVVEDITDLEKMELQFKQEQEQSGMLECVLENSIEDLKAAIKNFQESILECRTLSATIDPMSFMELQRVLHTLKGNARQLKMRVLSDQIHNSETAIMAQMSEIIHSDNAEGIITELNKIDKVIHAHVKLIQKFLHSESSWGEGLIPVYPLAIKQAEETVETCKDLVVPEVYQQIKGSIHRLGYKSVAALTTKFTSMVKDISQEFGKKIELEIEGDALASADQAEGISECLLHLIRNSIDHGLETPDVRLQLGKPETGRIKIYCLDSIDSVTITISDDGAGINVEKVVARAIKNGLVSVEKAVEISAQEKINLIFLPNLSTKDVATDISGRGLGMDVVKEKIEKLSGQLTLQSEKNKGMVITIKLYHTDAVAVPFKSVA